MAYERVLTIQDISCVGQCSLTVALPVLSACGLETAVLPSAVLSTHTGGFKGFTFRDLTEDMPAIARHWEKEGLRFKAVYTGYLGSAKQMEYVQNIVNRLCRPEGIFICDPAMADNGKLYTGFDMAFVEEMKKLCKTADYLLPNLTEACLLCGEPYREAYTEADILRICEKLAANERQTIVFTGVSYTPETTGVVVYKNGNAQYYAHQKMARGCHGTGDAYAAAFTGALVQGHTAFDAARIAAQFTLKAIQNSQNDESHWYGAKFETALPYLIQLLGLDK